MEKLKEQVEKGIESIIEQGIESNNLEALYQLVDIHKDLANEEYWKNKEEVMKMRYRGYGEYGNEYGRGEYGNESYGRRQRDSRGRYRDGGSMGARGYDAKYRGEETLGDMHEAYQDYSEGRNEMSMGNYGAKSDTMKSLDYMLQSVVEFIEMLKKDASSHEEVQLIQKYTDKISQM